MLFVRTAARVVVIVALAGAAGCGESKPAPSNVAVQPVHGKVVLGSQPLPGRLIKLTLVTNEKTANTEAVAEIQPDGTFEPKMVGDKPGLVVGKWKAVIQPLYIRDGKNLKAPVPAKYTSDSSPLTFEVKEGDNTPTLTLQP